MIRQAAVTVLIAAGLAVSLDASAGGSDVARTATDAVAAVAVGAAAGVPAAGGAASPGGAASVASTQAVSGADSYVALTPARLLDTRPGTATVDGQGAGGGVVAVGATVELQVTGRAGVPADAPAVVLNVTATGATDNGFVTAWPCGQPRPLASSLNYGAGRDVANAVLTKVGSGGKVCLYAGAAATHLIADVTGYFPAGTSYSALTPARLVDTRGGTTADGVNTPGVVAVGGTLQLRVGGRGGVPADAPAVVLNVTSAGATGSGFVTAYPCGENRPLASSLNYGAGRDVANAVITKVGAGGAVCIYAGAASTHLVVDVTGYFPTGSPYSPLSPARLADSRPGTSTVDNQYVGTGVVPAGGSMQFQAGGRGGVAPTSGAVVLNVTATGATGNGFLTVYPCGEPRPLASSLNYGVGRDVANAVLTKVGAGGKVCIYAGAGGTHVVVDVVGVLPAEPIAAAPPSGSSASCVFRKADAPVRVAFCDSFDVADPNPSSRSGDLNSVLWGVSRAGTHSNVGQGELNDFYPATLVGCGAPQTVLPPNDVRICNGRLLEAFWDNHQQQSINIYPKQPFDISGGRTGTVVFDVSADAEEPHAAWPEFWWTDKPVPSPHADISGHAPYARHSFGFSMAGTFSKAPSDSVGNPCGATRTTIDRVMVTRNYERFDIPFTSVDCVTKGSATGALNHFEVRINVNRVEIYASDAGSLDVRLVAFANGLELTFTKGLIWMEHLSYNACKFNNQCDHTFAWDNVGFDGPDTYRDLSFDVPDSNVPQGDGSIGLGYAVGLGQTATLTTLPVFRNQTPTGAIVTFNWWAEGDPVVPSFKLNGHQYTPAWPYTTESEGRGWRTIDVPVALDHVPDGPNTLKFTSSVGQIVSNVNVILIAGAPVPR